MNYINVLGKQPMPADNDSSLSAQHPINRSSAERANYLLTLGRWARGNVEQPFIATGSTKPDR